jgi:hypothetical protein
MKFQLFLSSLILAYSSLLAQEKKNYFPIWSFHQNNININGISIGLGSFNFEPKNTNTNGIKIELIGAGIVAPLIPGTPTSSSDSSFNSYMAKSRSEKISGLNIAGFGSFCDCQINGLLVGFIGHISTEVNGVSGAILMNYSESHNGLQIAMFTETFKMTGLQFGLRNNANKTKGVQIGLFNNGGKMKGVQIGLWNENEKRSLPLVNWDFKS